VIFPKELFNVHYLNRRIPTPYIRLSGPRGDFY